MDSLPPDEHGTGGALAAERVRVAIAGASSTVGWALACRLAPSHAVIALGDAPGGQAAAAGATWRACNLFNLLETERALAGAQVAVYLVRSMKAPACLTQGSAADLELTCADNFARAARANGVRHLVYLGEALPAPGDARTPRRERLVEIEQTLGAYGVPLTTLRAGRVLGARARGQPLSLEHALQWLELAIERPELAGRTHELAALDAVATGELLRTRPRAHPSRRAAAGAQRSRRSCSVQRLRLRPGGDAAGVAGEYFHWLSRLFPPLLRVAVDEARNCRISLWPLREPLLVLTFAADRSSPDRQLYCVTGGVLLGRSAEARPRLEFRTVLGGAYVLASLHDFVPRLPWFLYKRTQALLHLGVMRAFAWHLARRRA